MKTTFHFTENYERQLTKIEDHIYNSTTEIRTVDKFIAKNPTTPIRTEFTGDQSWPFGNGRYRIFFIVQKVSASENKIHLTDIIDNRMLNLFHYPDNTYPTFDED